uniref:Uncharacterized protein n=1 Tax=Oryza punctata TaxID=4537 RepID=A0A0E0KN41_ORYPU
MMRTSSIITRWQRRNKMGRGGGSRGRRGGPGRVAVLREKRRWKVADEHTMDRVKRMAAIRNMERPTTNGDICGYKYKTPYEERRTSQVRERQQSE